MTPIVDSQVSPLVEEICRPLRAVLAPSAYRKALWAVQVGLEKRFGEALADARRFAEETVELACIQRELSIHANGDCPMCCRPGLVCLAATEMEIRESALLTRLAGGF